MVTSKLTSEYISPVYIDITALGTFVCSGLSLSMRINTIPEATVTIPFGTLIGASKKGGVSISKNNDPSKVLSALHAVPGEKAKNMPECTIYETTQAGAKLKLFEGVVVSAVPRYRASGDGSTAELQLSCMHNACKLLTNPISAYLYASIGQLISQALKENNAIRPINPNSTGGEQELRAKIAEINKNVDIATGTEKVLDILLNTNGAVSDGTGGVKSKFTDYVVSNYAVNSALGVDVHVEYFYQLGLALSTQMAHGVLYDAVSSLLTSTEYMLQVVPSFTNMKQLKLEPSHAWSNSAFKTLTGDDIIAISSTTNALAMLNTPEVFFVYFQDPISFKSDDKKSDGINTSSQSFIQGVYSVDPAECARLRNAFNSKNATSGPALRDSTSIRRFCIFKAPSWLRPFGNSTSGGSTVSEKVVTDSKTEKETKQKQRGAETTRSSKDLEQAFDVACKVAEALFTFLYGSQDTVEVTLNPKLRFGGASSGAAGAVNALENHIGEVMDISVGAQPGFNPELKIRGVLTAIHYTRTCGIQSSVQYTATLSCVRSQDSKASTVDNPLYKKVRNFNL